MPLGRLLSRRKGKGKDQDNLTLEDVHDGDVQVSVPNTFLHTVASDGSMKGPLTRQGSDIDAELQPDSDDE
eukprot:gene10864-1974_t